MLDFFKQLLYRKPAAKFLFITQEPKENILMAVEKHLIPLDRIIITSATRKQMPVMLSFSTVAIFFIKNSFSKKASSPTKMGEIMSLGIPVICNAGVGDVEEIILKTKAGFAVSNFSETEYQNCIENLDMLLETPKAIIIGGAFEFYNLEKGVESYNKIYNNL
jgi:glycosyltransferase involved in cell wall biosynthesis